MDLKGVDGQVWGGCWMTLTSAAGLPKDSSTTNPFSCPFGDRQIKGTRRFRCKTEIDADTINKRMMVERGQ